MASSLVSRVVFRSIARASLWNPFVDLLNGTSTAWRAFIKADDATNPALKLQNVAGGSAPHFVIRNSGDTADVVRVTDAGLTAISTTFDVKSYGALGNAVADDAPAIALAIAAASAAGGGTVYFPPGNYYIGSAILVNAPNIYLRGPGITAALATATERACLTVNFASMPAIIFGGGGVSDGAGCGMEDLTIFHNVTPVGATYGGSTVSATIVVDRAGYVSGSGSGVVDNGDVRFDRIANAGALDMFQIGTVSNGKGGRNVHINHCSFSGSGNFAVVKGCEALFVRDCEAGESPIRGGGAFVLFNGPAGTTMPDPFICEGNLTESFSHFISFRHSGGSVGNSIIAGNVADGNAIGVYLNPQSGGTVNALSVLGNIINGFGDGVGTGAGNTWGVLVDQDGTGAVFRLIVQGNRITNFGNEGIRVEAPAADSLLRELWFLDNQIEGCGQAVTNTYAGISVNASGGFNAESFWVRGNIVTSRLTTNKQRNAVLVSSGNENFVVEGNIGLDMATSVVDKGTAGNGTTAIYKDNYGPVASGDMVPAPYVLIGPFQVDGATSTSTLRLATANGTATDGPTFVPAPFNGRVVGLMASATANVAGASASVTFNGTIAGSGTTLAGTIVTADATDLKVATQTSGDTFTQGQKLGASITVSGTLTANDFAVMLMVVPT